MTFIKSMLLYCFVGHSSFADSEEAAEDNRDSCEKNLDEIEELNRRQDELSLLRNGQKQNLKDLKRKRDAALAKLVLLESLDKLRSDYENFHNAPAEAKIDQTLGPTINDTLENIDKQFQKNMAFHSIFVALTDLKKVIGDDDSKAFNFDNIKDTFIKCSHEIQNLEETKTDKDEASVQARAKLGSCQDFIVNQKGLIGKLNEARLADRQGVDIALNNFNSLMMRVLNGADTTAQARAEVEQLRATLAPLTSVDTIEVVQGVSRDNEVKYDKDFYVLSRELTEDISFTTDFKKLFSDTDKTTTKAYKSARSFYKKVRKECPKSIKNCPKLSRKALYKGNEVSDDIFNFILKHKKSDLTNEKFNALVDASSKKINELAKDLGLSGNEKNAKIKEWNNLLLKEIDGEFNYCKSAGIDGLNVKKDNTKIQTAAFLKCINALSANKDKIAAQRNALSKEVEAANNGIKAYLYDEDFKTIQVLKNLAFKNAKHSCYKVADVANLRDLCNQEQTKYRFDAATDELLDFASDFGGQALVQIYNTPKTLHTEERVYRAISSQCGGKYRGGERMNCDNGSLEEPSDADDNQWVEIRELTEEEKVLCSSCNSAKREVRDIAIERTFTDRGSISDMQRDLQGGDNWAWAKHAALYGTPRLTQAYVYRHQSLANMEWSMFNAGIWGVSYRQNQHWGNLYYEHMLDSINFTTPDPIGGYAFL